MRGEAGAHEGNNGGFPEAGEGQYGLLVVLAGLVRLNQLNLTS